MQVSLFASDDPARLAPWCERLRTRGLEARVEPARTPIVACWGVSGGSHDLRIDHRELARAREALLDLAPEPLAGGGAGGGTVVLRLAGEGPGWRDLLGRGPGGVVRVVRRVSPAQDPSEDGRARERRLRTWAEALEAAGERRAALPPLVAWSLDPQGELELVWEPPPGPAQPLDGRGEADPLPLGAALAGYRSLRELSHEPELLLAPLAPADLFLGEGDRPLWRGVGLRALGCVAPESASWARPLAEWRADPVAAFRRELGGVLRCLLAGGASAPLPAPLQALEAGFAALQDPARPLAEAEAGLAEVLAGLGQPGALGRRDAGNAT